jgi:hypothetical protein
MKKHFLVVVLAASVLFTVACNKGGDDNSTPTTDTSPSAIVIDFPTAGTLYINGANITITGTIVDNNVLSQARVEIRNKTTGALLNQQAVSTSNVTFYRYTFNWTVTGITAPTQGAVKIIAKDKNNFEVSKEVDILLDN